MLRGKVEWKDGRRKRAMKVGLALRRFCAQASHYALFILGHLQARLSCICKVVDGKSASGLDQSRLGSASLRK